MTRRCFFAGTTALAVAALLPDRSMAAPEPAAWQPIGSTARDAEYAAVIEEARRGTADGLSADPDLLGIPDLWVLPVRCALCDGCPVMRELPPMLLADVIGIGCPRCPHNQVQAVCTLVAIQCENVGPYTRVSYAIESWNLRQARIAERPGIDILPEVYL